MTWKEFKESMDRQLKQKGIPEDTQMGWIDWSPALASDDPEIWYDEEIDELHIS